MRTVIGTPIPAQREATAVSPYEQGRSDSRHIHAARKTLSGLKAICDGSPISTVISGRFYPEGTDACPRCATALSAYR